MVPNPLEKEPQGRGIFFRTLQCVDSLKFFSFKFPFNTDSNQHFSRENAQARRDKTFHARDLAVPRVNRRSCILAKKKNAWSKELAKRAALDNRSRFASFRARHARGFPIYLELCGILVTSFFLTYVREN